MPFGGGVTVDRKRLADLIDALRLAIPANVRQARGIIERGEQAQAEAQAEAQRIVAAAERDAAERVGQSEVLRRATEEAHRVEVAAREAADRALRDARAEAQRILDEAERVAQQQRDEADAYAVALLQQLQRTLGAFLGNVRESLRAFPERTQPD